MALRCGQQREPYRMHHKWAEFNGGYEEGSIDAILFQLGYVELAAAAKADASRARTLSAAFLAVCGGAALRFGK